MERNCLNKQKKLEILREHIASFPDFPKKGILFWDIFSVLREPKIFHLLKELLIDTVKEIQPLPECIVGLDARGFLFGPLLALELDIPFVPVRKEGKLPGKVVTASYSKEYGNDTLAIQLGSIKTGQKVLIVDDLLATGGTLACASQLVKNVGGQVVACLIIIEIEELNGKQLITDDLVSLVKL